MAAKTDAGADAGNDDAPGANDTDNTAAALVAEFTAEELRRLAAHLPDASRDRGATKAETAAMIAERTDKDLSWLIGAGGWSVECSCGLRLSCGDPRVAKSEAEDHKSRNPTHFPSAVDDDDGSRIYG